MRKSDLDFSWNFKLGPVQTGYPRPGEMGGGGQSLLCPFEWDPIFGEGTRNLADGTLCGKGDPTPAEGPAA